jgi:hypothetical protein
MYLVGRRVVDPDSLTPDPAFQEITDPDMDPYLDPYLDPGPKTEEKNTAEHFLSFFYEKSQFTV